jgi:SAM-dependent methyltransferase
MQDGPQHSDNSAQIEYWNGRAGAQWRDRQDHQDRLLQPVSDRLLAAAAAGTGGIVIDVGCGCGETTIDFARAVAPNGRVVGIDVSAPMLDWARERAPRELAIRFDLADATVHAFEPAAADLIVSRFGVMFFADPARSFANLRAALKPGGRLVFVCWRPAKENPWMTVPLREAAKHAPPLPEMQPDDPGPFAFANPDRVRRILTEAGFVEIAIEPHDLKLDIAAGKGIDAATESALSIGPTSRILADQSQAVRAAVTADIRKKLAEYAVGDSVRLGAAIWIVSAINPAG